MTEHPEAPKKMPQDSAGDEFVPTDDAIIGRAFRWSLVAFVVLGASIAAILYFNRSDDVPPPVIDRDPIRPPDPLVQQDAGRPTVRFTNITAEAGIQFTHFNGATGEKLLPETMGGGSAFFDFDGDGDQDLLLINGAPWPHDGYNGPAPTPALYENDGTGRFRDVTVERGLDVTLYGMGAACGDIDNDGDIDLFISAVGPDRLFRNDDGHFIEITDMAGVAGGETDWSSSAGFLDYDNDGDLDLFVCKYIEWSRQIDLALNFSLNGRDRSYGPPTNFPGAFSSLYRNDGGSFVDVSEQAGIHITNPSTGEPMGKGLAVTFFDVDRDGWIDILVANDTVQNFIFQNRGDGTFREYGAVSGVAYDQNGNATGAMGVDAGDLENDGRVAFGIGNFANESSSLYVQQGDGWRFSDMANLEGIGSMSRLKLSFGLLFFDYDLDGRLDMVQANGHLDEEINQTQPEQHYRQAAQLFWNCGAEARSCFAFVPDDDVGDLSSHIVGRGASYADIDGDGDLDILLTQISGPPVLLRNDQSTGSNWIRVRLEGTQANRDAIGAIVEIESNGVLQRRQVMPTRSYLAQVERELTFGLEGSSSIDRISVQWPGGEKTELEPGQLNTTMIVKQ